MQLRNRQPARPVTRPERHVPATAPLRANVLADWPATFAAPADAIPFTGRGAMLPLGGLEILPPVAPRQVFQSGANRVRDLWEAR